MKRLVSTLCLLAVAVQVNAGTTKLACIDSIQLEQTVVDVFECEEKDRRFGASRILTACQAKISNKYTHRCDDGKTYRLTVACTGILETTGKDANKSKFTRATKQSVNSSVSLDTNKPGPVYLGYTYMDFSFLPEEIIHTADLLVAECRITDREAL